MEQGRRLQAYSSLYEAFFSFVYVKENRMEGSTEKPQKASLNT